VNEPLGHGFTLREEGQVELFMRRLTDLARPRVLQAATESVNTIFAHPRSVHCNTCPFRERWRVPGSACVPDRCV